ncbi:hypothetical protein KG090_03915 [Carnobacteriaceae bacterium zg-ZUI240]|nr:hypothetical protein [Carnobacteriaceae bacterium zg-ZUI240]
MVTDNLMIKLVPEAQQQFSRRLSILLLVELNEVIGRRTIADSLKLSERIVRNEIEQLKQLGFVTQSKNGLSLTDNGRVFLSDIHRDSKNEQERLVLQEQLKNKYQLRDCIVVPGDATVNQDTIIHLGQALSNILNRVLPTGENILSVSGGTTLSKVVSHVSKNVAKNRQFYVVPTRGSGSGDLSIQANTISHTLAQRLNGETLNLYIPEQISSSSQELLLEDPTISNTVSLLKKSNCLIYSIGDATIMASRRGASAKEIDRIKESGAVGEAMGVFFNAHGQIVYRLARIGLYIDDLHNLPCEVLVVGGSSKALALSAYLKMVPQQTILIVDETLANLVLKEDTL